MKLRLMAGRTRSTSASMRSTSGAGSHRSRQTNSFWARYSRRTRSTSSVASAPATVSATAVVVSLTHFLRLRGSVEPGFYTAVLDSTLPLSPPPRRLAGRTFLWSQEAGRGIRSSRHHRRGELRLVARAGRPLLSQRARERLHPRSHAPPARPLPRRGHRVLGRLRHRRPQG